jgi:drug/metabolite transporter (DMT)-like permease
VREFILLMSVVILGTFGEIFMARAMRAVGEFGKFSFSAVWDFLAKSMRSGWMWVGLSMMTGAFFSLLAMLSMDNVSFVVPVTALNYAVGAGGASLFLGEHVSKRRWLGVAVVCVGVTVVWWSRR